MVRTTSRSLGSADDVTIRPLRAGDSLEASDLLKFYEEAIPTNERKAPEAVLRMLERADYCVLGAFTENRLVGFLAVYGFRQQSLSLLEYMAVGSRWRGRGIGSQLFGELLAFRSNSDPLLLEVDSDRFSSLDNQQRIARKHFYRRLGCREVHGLTYQLPLPGDPPPMDILVHWPGRSWVQCTMIRQWLTALYVEVYGQPESDPRIPAMVACLPDQVPLV